MLLLMVSRFITLLLLLAPLFSSAQDYNIRLQSGAFVPEANLDLFEQQAPPSAMVFGERYRFMLQFYQMPNENERASLHASGLQWLGFLPNYAWIVSAPLSFDRSLLRQAGARAVVWPSAIHKMEKNLAGAEIPAWASDGAFVKLNLLFYADADLWDALQDLNTQGFEVLDFQMENRIATLRVPLANWWSIGALPYVEFVESISPPAEPEDLLGQTYHISNMINSHLPGGYRFAGNGVHAAIGDDGVIGPHIDFTGRLNEIRLSSGNDGTHGDMVAGILGGAGNLDPRMGGMAPGATLHILRVWDAVNQSPTLHTAEGVVLTNTSYSDGCNRGYSTFARTADQQSVDYPSLLHVFSGGNQGTQDCGYGAGAGWGNITGGVKIGKNVIAAANSRNDGSLESSSSRGPTADGRLKPDITANGQGQMSTDPNNTYASGGGTSAAAPGIAGICAQLYEAWRSWHNGANPPAALIKAALLNTAEDMGRPGPDFEFGFGRVHAYNAMKLLEQNWFFNGSVAQGGNQTHSLQIPTGVAEARIMLYWLDPPATPMAAPALVNDLNLSVRDPQNTNYLPLVLDYTPVVANLRAPAVPGVDNRNNVEQVVLSNPAAGTYTLRVNGATLGAGPQDYFLLFHYIEDNIRLTYPIGGESFAPFETERIRWDALGATGNFSLSYSTDNGANWNTIGNVAGNLRQYNWNVPNSVSGDVKIRITRGTLQAESDAISIVGVPGNLRVTQVCPNYIRFNWDAIPGASEYQVYMLGQQYMDAIGTAPATTVDINGTNYQQDYWLSVSAANPTTHITGRRAVAIYVPPGLLNCAINRPVAAFVPPSVACGSQPVLLQDASTDAPASWQWNISPATVSYVNGTNSQSPSPYVVFNQKGRYRIELITSNTAGSDTAVQFLDVQYLVPFSDFIVHPGGLSYIFESKAQNAFFYQWDFGDGATSTQINPSHVYASSGSYLVTFTVSNPCGTVTSQQTLVVVGTAVQELGEGLKVTAWPNPAKDFLQLSAGESSLPIVYELLDVQGKRLQRGRFSGETQLVVTGLSPGMYVLRLRQGPQRGALRVVVE